MTDQTAPAGAIRITERIQLSRRTFALLFTLGLTAASVAGVALGIVAAVTADRMRGIFGEVQWGEDE